MKTTFYYFPIFQRGDGLQRNLELFYDSNGIFEGFCTSLVIYADGSLTLKVYRPLWLFKTRIDSELKYLLLHWSMQWYTFLWDLQKTHFLSELGRSSHKKAYASSVAIIRIQVNTKHCMQLAQGKCRPSILSETSLARTSLNHWE